MRSSSNIMVLGHVLDHPELATAAHHLDASQHSELGANHVRIVQRFVAFIFVGVLSNILTTQNRPDPRLMRSMWVDSQLLGMSNQPTGVEDRRRRPCQVRRGEVSGAQVVGPGAGQAEPEDELRDMLRPAVWNGSFQFPARLHCQRVVSKA